MPQENTTALYGDEATEDIYTNRYEKKRHGSKQLHIAAYSSNEFGSLCHHHSEFELIFVSEGEIHILINNDFISLHAGEAVFIDKECIHHLDYDIRMRSLENRYYTILFSSDFLGNDACCDFLERFSFNTHISLSDKSQKFVTDIYDLLQSRQNGFEFLVKSHLAAIIYELIADKKYSERSGCDISGAPVTVSRIIDYINNNYSRKISIEDLANHVSYSANYISRLFRRYCKMSIVDYINRVRLNNVCHELVNTQNKIIDIAATSGFSNIGYFNRVFLRSFGCTPFSYRKQHSHIAPTGNT